MTTENVEVKKSLVTLKSALEAHNIDQLASVLAKMGTDKKSIQKFGLTFSLAVKAAQVLHKDQEAAKEQAKIEAAEKRAETIKQRQASEAAQAKADAAARAVEAENMLNNLVQEMGLDLAVANEMVSVAMAKKYPEKKETSFKFNRVAIDYKGEVYNMPTTGNMPQVWKDRVADECDNERGAFILKYAVDAEQAAEILEQKNGITA
jgi:hypothetical protein